ncbi:DEAD/DEAH box helicase, partial [Candidatus Uhrbacteria bacterium]|nr:DEAD/DEAH box helicase [Candidatus Uhrbacteria bacterium]
FIYRDPEILGTVSPEWADVYQDIKERNQVVFHSFDHSGTTKLDYGAPTKYHQNLTAFFSDLVQRQKDNWQIYLAVNETLRLSNLLKEHQIKLSTNTRVATHRSEVDGFISEQDKVLILTEKELFFSPESKKARGRQKTKRVDWGFFTNIKQGENVVHEDHGVAIFGGLVKTTVQDELKEFFLLEYAEGDKLYLPVDQAHKVDKYIGQAHPKIHRLSSASWGQLTAKVKEDTHKLAQDLLNLYARRNVVQIDPWHGPHQEEQQLAKSFPYQETPDQQKAIKEVFEDMEKPNPMDRLVIGDVGFGKTEVAIRAAFKAVMNGKQVAVLAPTTILVQQHVDTFLKRLENFGVNIQGLSRFTSKLESARREKDIIAALKLGTVDIVIGTSRLLSPDAKFKNLGLVIIDEEQRFGVRHKEKLKMLRTQAHVLTISATPIPRTLYLAMAGLRNASVISTPPAGRQEISTAISQYSDNLIKEAIAKELARHGQVYYLYNKVASIGVTLNRLRKLVGDNVRFGVVHGQLPEEEIARNMWLFDNGEIDVLVCSSIIENGLDLPNVNTLIVEDATSFGLGQLYQLRGRIGRGAAKAYAHFLYRPERVKGLAGERLRALQEAQGLGSGYQLALKDMEMRGVGNILGKQQHGSVAQVGLSTYLRLLEQAVREVEEGVIVEPGEVKISMQMPLGISEKAVPDYEKRVQLYRTYALINDLADLEEEIRKFKKAYDVSTFDQDTKNFFDLLKVKILADLIPVKSIEYSVVRGMDDKKLGKILIESSKFVQARYMTVLKNEGFQVLGRLAKIKLPIGENILDKLLKLCQTLLDTAQKDPALLAGNGRAHSLTSGR